MRHSSFGLVLLIAAICVTSSAVAQTWNLQTVDNAGDVGYNSRIAVTSDGTPYILYIASNEIRLAWWVPSGDSSGGWNSTVVGTNSIAAYRSLAICADAYGDLHIAWGEFGNSGYSQCRLKYAVFDSESKELIAEDVKIASTGFFAYYPDLALVDSTGTITPTIAYIEAVGSPVPYINLKYATRNSGTGTWSFGVIDDVHHVGTQVSIAVDSKDGFHVSYYEDLADDLMYATKAAGDTTWTWSYVDINDAVGQHSSIIVDDQDHPYIVYYDETNGDLKYAKMTSE